MNDNHIDNDVREIMFNKVLKVYRCHYNQVSYLLKYTIHDIENDNIENTEAYILIDKIVEKPFINPLNRNNLINIIFYFNNDEIICKDKPNNRRILIREDDLHKVKLMIRKEKIKKIDKII